MVPARIVDGIGNSREEVRRGERPALGGTDREREGLRVVVREGVTERLTGTVKEILAVHEGGGALDGRFREHEAPWGKRKPRRRPEG